MIQNYLSSLGGGSFFTGPIGLVMLFIVVAWSLVWKGLALWRSARDDSKVWFVVFILINTLGILEIVYLLFFTKKARADRAATGARKEVVTSSSDQNGKNK